MLNQPRGAPGFCQECFLTTGLATGEQVNPLRTASRSMTVGERSGRGDAARVPRAVTGRPEKWGASATASCPPKRGTASSKGVTQIGKAHCCIDPASAVFGLAHASVYCQTP